MKAEIRYHHTLLDIEFPDTSRIYLSSYDPPAAVEPELVLQAIRNPLCSESLVDSIKTRPRNSVMIAVSDITRPIPYRTFLPVLLDEIESTGIDRKQITLLIATGMHRPSTKEERLSCLGMILPADIKFWIMMPKETWSPFPAQAVPVLRQNSTETLRRRIIKSSSGLSSLILWRVFQAGANALSRPLLHGNHQALSRV